MWFTTFALVIILGGICGGSLATPAAVEGFSVPAKTSVPFTYCISYRSDPDQPSFLEELKKSPPDLFHLGYHIPFKGALGPTFGHDLFSDDILAPDQVAREVERDEKVVHDMRGAGVGRLIPYVFTMAFFGNVDLRTGFFWFFDHWEDYRQFGLGPKPAGDPSLWSQQRGPEPLVDKHPDVNHYSPCINHPAWREYLDLVVRQLAGVGYDGMFFDVNTLVCDCPHCQEQFDLYLLQKYGRDGLQEAFSTNDHRLLNLSTIDRDFEKKVLDSFKTFLKERWELENLSIILGASGSEQVKLEEDWRLLRCYMQGSLGEFPPEDNYQEYLSNKFGGQRLEGISSGLKDEFKQTVLRHEFHEFLESNELAHQLENQFGSSDVRRRCCATSKDLLLWVETQRFWCDSMGSLFHQLKEDGRSTFAKNGRQEVFFTVANLGSMITVDAINKRRVNAIDLVRWARSADVQMFEEMHQPGSLESGVILSNIFAFKWAMAAGTRAGTLLYGVNDDRAADLAEAEVAAGGGGAFIQPGLAAPESRARWKAFYSGHADLWEGGDSWAKVGLVFWNDQVFYEYPEHLAMTRRLVHILSESQIPFDLVSEENTQDLSRYQVLFVPQLRYLDGKQIERLISYAEGGGNLVVIPPFGTEDKLARPRSSNLLVERYPVLEKMGTVACGRGKILLFPPHAVPQRQSDLWCLMEERGNDLFRTREFLNAARQDDLNSGKDMGAQFIQKIENELGVKLGWCPAQTDPGIYIHAYHLPPSTSQPERLVLHSVNYRLPILLEERVQNSDPPVSRPGQPIPAKNLKIDIPLPPGRTVKSIEALSPTETVRPVSWQVEGNQVNLSIDELTIYQAVLINLQGSDPGQ